MSRPDMEWDDMYRRGVPPPWSIGAPQPELAALLDAGPAQCPVQGTVRGEVLDAGCGEAALSLELAARGHTVVGLDCSAAAVAAATATAAERGLTTATFAQADLTEFGGYDGRFSTIIDSGLLHALPVDRRQAYLRAIHRAAAPNARLFILTFAERPFGDGHGPDGFTAEELRDTVGVLWTVDEIRPAKLYVNDFTGDLLDGPPTAYERAADGKLMFPGFLVSAHKD
ncbi:class I SAM-dependent methyltransferase [Mycolicibacterium thermoresistibile]|nr:class I SAM-dependent methyltransferase [Mycolicibacterium thermoresistibile]MCV7190415.1 class I SAM-dependent methyltransferase [Mycolicibacterium thermoresistibile]GAT14222.1 methyltransferase [Mycolicibacterium thermoresistibile]SNW20777.1 methyltransferase [Mycolicibacterium thermoresistibile]